MVALKSTLPHLPLPQVEQGILRLDEVKDTLCNWLEKEP